MRHLKRLLRGIVSFTVPEQVLKEIGPLCDHHDRAAFSCGVQALDRYLQKQAGQDQRKNIARVFVKEGPEPHIIAGFYTLSSLGVDVGDLPEDRRKKLPGYPVVPATLIGRLAVDQQFRGQGIGSLLLIDAISRIDRVSRQIASYAVIVDAKDDVAKSFYRHFGFIEFQSASNRLFLPLETARRAIQEG